MTPLTPPTPRELFSQIRRRWGYGEVPDVAAVLRENPQLLEDRFVVLDLIYDEYCKRIERGDEPTRQEFYERYPEYERSLRQVFEIDDLIGVKPEEARRQRCRRPPPERWPEAGETIGDLTLLRLLGRGTFSRVFLAREEHTGNRPIVVKLTFDGLHEACTLGPLEHAHIVPVLSARDEPTIGLSIVRMPYLGEATLEDLLRHTFPRPGVRPPASADIVTKVRGARPGADGEADPSAPNDQCSYEKAIYRILAQMADALRFLHREGICHRDIKPSNVLLGFTGKAMLLDFNLSADGRPDEAVGGTLRYMAPEQLLACHDQKAPLPGPAADVFALGVIAYELLTGQHPFGPSLAPNSTRRMIVEMGDRHQSEALPLEGLNPRVAPCVAQLLQRCLALEPEARPTAAELRIALENQLASPSGWFGWLRRPYNAAAAVLVLALTAFGAAQVVMSSDPEAEARRAYQQGRDLLAQGKPALALDYFSESNRQRRTGRALARQAYCEALSPNHPRALELCNEAIDHGFTSARLHNLRGYIQMQLGERPNDLEEANKVYEKAEKDFTEALRREPDLQAGYYNRAMLLYRRTIRPGKNDLPDAAVADMREALKKGPVSGALARDAARLFALGSQRKPELRKDALDSLTLALEKGCDPDQLLREHFLKPLLQDERFKDLLKAKKVPQLRSVETQLPDPVNDD